MTEKYQWDKKVQDVPTWKWNTRTGTLSLTCAPLTFNVLPQKEHLLQNYSLPDCYILHMLLVEKLFVIFSDLKDKMTFLQRKSSTFFSILSRHVFHLYAWYCSNIYLVSLQRRKHFESLRIAWFPTRGFLYCHSIIRGKPAPLFFFPENINEYPFLQLCSRQKLEILASPNSTK